MVSMNSKRDCPYLPKAQYESLLARIDLRKGSGTGMLGLRKLDDM